MTQRGSDTVNPLYHGLLCTVVLCEINSLIYGCFSHLRRCNSSDVHNRRGQTLAPRMVTDGQQYNEWQMFVFVWGKFMPLTRLVPYSCTNTATD